MKTIFRFLSLGLLLTAFLAVGTTAGLAQDPVATPTSEAAACSETGSGAAQEALHAKIREAYQKDEKAALETGKQLIEKYGTCAVSADFVKWLRGTPAIPAEGSTPAQPAVQGMMERWEKSIAAKAGAAARSAIMKRVDVAVESKNWDQVYAAGSEFASKYPDDPSLINFIIPLGEIGYYESYSPAKNYKYNDDTIKYAKMAISYLKAGKPCSKTVKGVVIPKCGVYFSEDTKENVLSELNYSIAYITYFAKGDKKGALPYYYEALQQPGTFKDDVGIYQAIGAYYYEEYQRLAKDYAALAATQKPGDTPEMRTQQEAQLKEKSGFVNAYLERTLDAYGRAHKLMKSDPATKTAKDAMYKSLQELYKIRFQKDEGFDAYLASTVTKPMPNPTSPVTPIVDLEPVTPVTTTTTTTPVKPAPTTPTKPVSTVTTKVSVQETSTAAKPAATTTAVKAKTVVKKPVVKKKGTR